MNNKLYIDDYILSYTIIKYKKQIYLITTPHGIFIDKDIEYPFNYNDNRYFVKLYRQSYWCDLAIFNITSEFPHNYNEIKILQSITKIYNLRVNNYENNIKGVISNISNLCHLDINGGNRNLYYQLETIDNINQGMSGTGMYSNNKLIGLISNSSGNKSFLVPSFFIIKMFNEKTSDYSPYLPLKLTMENNKVMLVNNYSALKRGFIIEKFNNLIVDKGHVYVNEIKSNIPIDVYLQIYGTTNNYIVISNNKLNYKIKIQDLNNHLKHPFISGISKKEKEQLNKTLFQDIWNK